MSADGRNGASEGITPLKFTCGAAKITLDAASTTAGLKLPLGNLRIRTAEDVKNYVPFQISEMLEENTYVILQAL